MAIKYAILGDIHANIEAFDAVLQDVKQENPDKIAILGDVIGYGPNPKECWKKAYSIADLLIIGNHEKEILEPEPGMNADNIEFLKWTAKELQGSQAWQSFLAQIKGEDLAGLAKRSYHGKAFFHGSQKNPTKQYIWPAHECQYLIYNGQIDERLQEFLAEFEEEHGFCGHTHQPAILTEYQNHTIFDPYKAELEWDRQKTFVGPNTLFMVPKGNIQIKGLKDKKVLINPGSVGQPRDGDARASYAIYDGDSVRIKRVPYDFSKTQEKILALPIDEKIKKDNSDRLAAGA